MELRKNNILKHLGDLPTEIPVGCKSLENNFFGYDQTITSMYFRYLLFIVFLLQVFLYV